MENMEKKSTFVKIEGHNRSSYGSHYNIRDPFHAGEISARSKHFMEEINKARISSGFPPLEEEKK